MKLASLKSDRRDGRLVVVSKDLTLCVADPKAPATLQEAIERWADAEPRLRVLYEDLNRGAAQQAVPFDPTQAMAPLPRAYQWCDGSAFMSHGSLTQRAFNLAPIEGADRIPLIYQGSGDDFLGPCDDIVLPSEEDGIDFEGEFAVLVDDVPMRCSADAATPHVKLILQVNDVSCRQFVVRELKAGFGFFNAKPSSAFAPVAVTPDELGAAWSAGRVCLPLQVEWNGNWFGHPNGKEMHFSFPELIAHATLTRRLRAGTIIGSGTVSNWDRQAGSACIAERRAIEMIESGAAKTQFMRFGDRVRMEARGLDGGVLFGAIAQQVAPCNNAGGVS
jgi:fumarylacetoacetate (FAA) hydrolase